MAKTEENLSQSKYAEHRNVTKGYIGRLIKEGRLHLIKGKLNVEMSDAELDNKSLAKSPVSMYPSWMLFFCPQSVHKIRFDHATTRIQSI